MPAITIPAITINDRSAPIRRLPACPIAHRAVGSGTTGIEQSGRAGLRVDMPGNYPGNYHWIRRKRYVR
jgi:hypothetical protein